MLCQLPDGVWRQLSRENVLENSVDIHELFSRSYNYYQDWNLPCFGVYEIEVLMCGLVIQYLT